MAEVVEDVRGQTSWRRRMVAGWVIAIILAVAGMTGFGVLAWQVPLLGNPLLWVALAATVAAGWYGHRGWRRWRHWRAPSPLRWREGLPTPYGPRSGWEIRRPLALSSQDRLTAAGAQLLIVVVIGVVSIRGGYVSAEVVADAVADVVFLIPVVFVIPVAVMFVVRLARRIRFPAGVVITAEGVATASGLTRWTAIKAIEVRSRLWGRSAVRLVTSGRRPLVIPGCDHQLSPAALRDLLERYRQGPQRALDPLRPPSLQDPGRDVAGGDDRPAHRHHQQQHETDHKEDDH